MGGAKTIRLKCLDCCCGSHNEVKLCPVTSCPLWEWRFGCYPDTARRKYPEHMDPETIVDLGRSCP